VSSCFTYVVANALDVPVTVIPQFATCALFSLSPETVYLAEIPLIAQIVRSTNTNKTAAERIALFVLIVFPPKLNFYFCFVLFFCIIEQTVTQQYKKRPDRISNTSR
jgi:hypothetical protein